MSQPTNRSFLGIAKETTPGTYVAPVDYLPVRTFDPDHKIKYLEDKGIRGSMVDTYGLVQGPAHSEYSFGGEKDASGAVAEAEALGVFGREGVDLAAYWTYPPPDSPAGAAFRLYRNYDGHGGTFGDRSLRTTSGSSQLAAFAARHSDSGEVDVVIANESQSAPTSVTLSLTGTLPRSATEYVVNAGSGTIQRVPMASALSAVSLPPLTVALVRLTS